VLIVPVYEQQLVVTQRLVLRERLRIRRVGTTESVSFRGHTAPPAVGRGRPAAHRAWGTNLYEVRTPRGGPVSRNGAVLAADCRTVRLAIELGTWDICSNEGFRP
jgi:hypothetical protein